MLFLLIDYITSLTLNVALSVGAWAVYRSANGLYYAYRWASGKNNYKQIPMDEKSLVVLTAEEYDKLIETKQDIQQILQRLEERKVG